MRVLLLIVAGGMMLPVAATVARAQGAPSVYLPDDHGSPYERPATNPLEIVDRSAGASATPRNGVTPIPAPPQSGWDPQPTPSPSYPNEQRSPEAQYPQPEYGDPYHLEPAPPTPTDRTLPQQPARIDSPPSTPLVSDSSLTPAPSAVRACPKRGTGTLHLASEFGNRHDIREPVPVYGQTLSGSIPPAWPEDGVAPVVYQQDAEAASRSAEPAGTVEGRALTSTSDGSDSVPLGPTDGKPSVALAAPDKEAVSREGRFGTLNSALTMISGLGVVLAIFLLVAWGLRRANPKAMGVLPQQVVEVLGRAPLAGRQQVYMIRCGAKLVLVSVTPDGAEPLTEITDPFEVDRLAGLCEQTRPTSSTATFRRVLNQYALHGETADVG